MYPGNVQTPPDHRGTPSAPHASPSHTRSSLLPTPVPFAPSPHSTWCLPHPTSFSLTSQVLSCPCGFLRLCPLSSLLSPLSTACSLLLQVICQLPSTLTHHISPHFPKPSSHLGVAPPPPLCSCRDTPFLKCPLQIPMTSPRLYHLSTLPYPPPAPLHEPHCVPYGTLSSSHTPWPSPNPRPIIRESLFLLLHPQLTPSHTSLPPSLAAAFHLHPLHLDLLYAA